MFLGPRRVFTSRALSWRRGGHVVRVWRRGRSAGLSVDARHNVTGNAPAHTDKMTLLPYLYLGQCLLCLLFNFRMLKLRPGQNPLPKLRISNSINFL